MRLLILLFGCSFLLASCATPSPPTSKNSKNGSSPDDQEKMAYRAFDNLKQSGNPICALVYQGIYPDCRYFNLFLRDRPALNAFPYGNTNISVHREILSYLKNEDEVAFLIAHNMAHHLADHYYEVRDDTSFSFVVSGYQRTADGKSTYINRRPGPGFDENGPHKYIVSQEYEADYIAAYLLAAAGYDVGAAIKFYKKMHSLNPSNGKAEKSEAGFLDTHPFTSSKIIRLQKTAKEIADKISKNQPLLPNEMVSE